MMEMTGEIADGVVLNYCVPPEYNYKALDLLRSGAQKAGRNFDEIDRPQLIVCSVDLDHDKAIDTTRELLTQYLAQQPHIAKHQAFQWMLYNRFNQFLDGPQRMNRSRRQNTWFLKI
jgi:5,10-methylenetetrahydromethanopterin reductase